MLIFFQICEMFMGYFEVINEFNLKTRKMKKRKNNRSKKNERETH